jgi:hypothetical protein
LIAIQTSILSWTRYRGDVRERIRPNSALVVHWSLKKEGAPPVTIPNHKELKKGLEHALKKILEKVKKGN